VVAGVVGLAVVGLGLVAVMTSADDGPDDREGPTVTAASAAVDPEDYAEAVTTACTDGLARAEAVGYDESSRAGAEAIDEVAATLAAIAPPEGGQERAQALVDGVIDYAELFRERDDDPEDFSQRQNELTVVIAARADLVGADCGEGEFVLFAAQPADPDDVTAAGDPALSDRAAACFEGDLGACDDLGESDSALVYYGITCGGRLLHEEADDRYSCVETYAGERLVR